MYVFFADAVLKGNQKLQTAFFNAIAHDMGFNGEFEYYKWYTLQLDDVVAYKV